MKRFTLAIIAAALTLCGCSKKENFTIEGSINGAGVQNVTLTYFADGGIKKETVPASDGKFTINGVSADPTLGILSIAPDNQRLATLIVGNGDHLTVAADMADPLATEVTGNSESELTSKWIRDNAATLKSLNANAINRAIAKFVEGNKENRASMALLSGYFQTEGYESMADSLFSLLTVEVRQPEIVQGFNNVITAALGNRANAPLAYLTLYERRDSLVHINPQHHSTTLLCIVDENRRMRDSVATVLDTMTRHHSRRRLQAVEISTAADSASWRASLSVDSVGWPQAWLPGSLANAAVRRLGIPRVPYFIAADSTGMIIYRGSSITQASAAIEAKLSKH